MWRKYNLILSFSYRNNQQYCLMSWCCTNVYLRQHHCWSWGIFHQSWAHILGLYSTKLQVSPKFEAWPTLGFVNRFMEDAIWSNLTIKKNTDLQFSQETPGFHGLRIWALWIHNIHESSLIKQGYEKKSGPKSLACVLYSICIIYYSSICITNCIF